MTYEAENYKKLAFAVLKQAYYDIQIIGKGKVRREAGDKEAATQWIKDTSKHKCSFTYWCTVAGLDPGTLRKGLLESITSLELREKLSNIFRHYQ